MTASTTPEHSLVERLRQHRVILKSGDYDGTDLMKAWCDMINAADLIEKLIADRARLEKLLRDFVEAHDEWIESAAGTHAEVNACAKMLRANVNAEAALTGKDTDQ